MAQTRRAVTLTVDFGFTQVQGLMLPDGSYAIAVSQIAEHFGFTQNNATRQVKALLGKGSNLTKTASDIAKRPVNTVTIAQFKSVVLSLSKQGHPVAGAFVDALVEEGIERRFNTAAGVHVEESEYNAQLKQRMERVTARLEWTDVIRDRSLALTGRPAPEGVYSGLTRQVNMALFGRPNFHGNRDNMTPREQRIITAFETMVVMFADRFPRATPTELITRALDSWAGK